MTLHVRDLMTDEVLTLDPLDALSKAWDLMTEAHIRHVPVINPDRTVEGLISERDLLRRFPARVDATVEEEREALAAVTIEEVMQRDVLTISSDQELSEAASLMFENKVGCLPVVDDDQLIGILTESDFVQYFLPEPRIDQIARTRSAVESASTIEGRVVHGHLVVDEPVELPEGTAVHLVVTEDLDELEEQLAGRTVPRRDADLAIARSDDEATMEGEEALGIIEDGS
jgi:CBS-domain-containing membrane protein